MRSNIISSFGAVFAAFLQFAAVFAVFGQPVSAIADQPAGAMTTLSATQKHGVRGVLEVIVEVRRAI